MTGCNLPIELLEEKPDSLLIFFEQLTLTLSFILSMMTLSIVR
jgi:hypothetical protein